MSHISSLRRDALPVALVIVGLTGTLCLEDRLGYLVLELSLPSVHLTFDGYLLMCLLQSVGAVVLLVLPKKEETPFDFGMIAALGLCVVVTLLVFVVGSFTPSAVPNLDQFVFVLLALMSLTASIAFVLPLCAMAQPKRVLALLLVEVGRAVASPIIAASDVSDGLLAPVVLTMVLEIAVVYALMVRLPRKSDEQYGELVAVKPVSSFPAMAGFAILVVGLAFFGPTGLIRGIPTGSSYQFGFLSYFIAIALFAVCASSFEKNSAAFGIKLVQAICLSSVVVYFATDSSQIPELLCSAAFSFIELYSLLIVIDYVSHTKIDPLRALGAYFLILRFCTALGTAVYLLGAQLQPNATAYLGSLVAIVMVFSMGWLATDRNVNRFMWGGAAGGSNSPVEDRESSVNYVADVARRYQLTAREQEVLALLGQGRSATFIADDLVISTNTAKRHIAHIYQKCGVHSRQEMLTLLQTFK